MEPSGGPKTKLIFSTKDEQGHDLLKKAIWNLVLLNLGLIASFIFVQHAMFYTFPPDIGKFIWVGREVYLIGSLSFFAFVRAVSVIVRKT
ncbi:MAG: hypothetical protein ACE5QF_05850 [Thermoplasmata archaeon]